MTIRVLIVDDHAVVRSGLRHVLDAEDGIEVVGEAGDAQHAVFETRAKKPDVILMDVVMPGRSGIETIPDVLQRLQNLATHFREGLRSGIGVGRVLDGFQPEQDRGQLLAGLVVELACQAAPFELLRLNDPSQRVGCDTS